MSTDYEPYHHSRNNRFLLFGLPALMCFAFAFLVAGYIGYYLCRIDVPSKKQPSFDFEKSIEELNSIVEQMEQGDLSLEQSLKSFERGIALTRQCQDALKTAEQTVKILTEQSENADLDDYQTE